MLGSKCLNETQALAGLLDNELMSRLSAPAPHPKRKVLRTLQHPLQVQRGGGLGWLMAWAPPWSRGVPTYDLRWAKRSDSLCRGW